MARNRREDEELDKLLSSSLGAEPEKPQKKSALDQMIADSLGEGYQERQTTAHRDLIGGTERPAAVRNWVQQYNNLMPKVGRVQEANGGRYTEDIFGGYRDDIDRLIAQYEQIRPYAKDYGLSPSAYSGLRRLVSDMDSRSQLMQEMGESGYNAAMWRQKYQGQSLEDINKAIASAGTKADERAWLQNFKDFDSGLHQSMTEEERSAAMEQHRTELESMTAERDKLRQQVIGYSRAIGMKKQQEEAEERIKELEKQISETNGKLQTMDWDNNLANRNARAAEWEKVDANLGYDKAAAAGAARVNPRLEDVIYGEATGNTVEIGNKLEYYFQNRGHESASMDKTIQQGNFKSWDQLTEKERKRYSYLLEAKGEAEADQYLQDMQIILDRRRTEQEQLTRLNNWKDDNIFEKIGKNLLTIPGNVVGGGMAALSDINSAAQGEFNPYGRAHAVTEYAQQIRQMSSDDIVKGLKDADPMWGKIVSNTYQGIMSGFDSALGATLLGQGYTAMMAAGAASSRAKELYEAGANDWQIAVGAVASGAIEAAFEYYSVDKFAENFLEGNIKNVGDWALKTLLQGGIEASEEVNTELGNMIANALILGANSDNQREIRELMSQGMSREEAERQATMNRCVDVFWAAYGGFVSGGGMGGFGGAVNGIRANQYYKAAGSNIIQNEETANTIQAAKDAGVNAKLLALAESKAQATIDNWNEASGRQQRAAARTMGRLYEATTNAQAEAADTAEKRTFRDRVTEILKKQGSKNAAEAAEVITKATYEGELNSRESEIYEAAKGNEVVSEVQNSREFREAAKAATQTAQETYRKTAVAAADMYSPVNPRTLRENKKTVESMADAYAEPQVMIDTYQDGQNPYQYEYAYQRAYEMGKEGIGIEYAMSAAGTQYLKQNQIQAAYESGRKAGGYGTESNGVRQGQKWNDRENPSRPAQGMEAGAAESRPQAEGSTAEKAAGRVSTRDLGIADGTDNKNLQIRQEKDYTEADRKAQDTAKKHGLKLVVVQGDSIQVTETAKDGSKYMVKARALVSGDTVIVRGDDPMFDSGMIAGHEVTHKRIERGEISIDDVRQELRSRYTDAEINDIIDLYAAAYGNTGMTADEILEEIICDAQGEMNAFATDVTKAVAGEVGLFLRRTAAATARAGRGEAQQRTGAKASRETVQRIEETIRVPENRQEAKSSLYGSAADIGNVQDEVKRSTQFDGEYMAKAMEMNQQTKKVGDDVMKAAAAIRADMQKEMKRLQADKKVALPKDILGNTYFANGSYDGSEENTSICPRSLASEAFVDAVSEMLGRPLTVAEQVYVSQDLQSMTTTPECLYCYVATDRKAYREFLGRYIQQRDAVLDKIKAGETDMDKLYKEFLDGRKHTPNMKTRFDLWVDTYRNGGQMVQASHLTNMQKLMGDIESEFGKELKAQIKDAMAYAQSASWAKKRVNYVAYNNHILKWGADRIRKLNSHYGLRMYSFSDFHPAFILENMQMITDASVRGLKMLAYTKDMDFVKIFAGTGMNINVSVFGVEKNETVAENNIIGAAWEEAQQLRAQHPNVGITFVATNDRLTEWALEQPWIDVVIPYHLVRTGAEVAKALDYTNYTSESSDGKADDWKEWSADKDKKKLVKSIPPTMHNNDRATYMAALKEHHLTPRFARWQDNPNYMKLVNECRRSASESTPVQPVFNLDAAKESLAKLEATGYYTPIGGDIDRMYELALQESEKISGDEFREWKTEKKLSREIDTEYLSLAKDPEANEARLREMVEARAKEAGYTEKVFHGSEYYGFTKVDTEKSDDKISFFASGTEVTAETYSGAQNVRRIGKQGNEGRYVNFDGETVEGNRGNYELMANTEGMLEVDAQWENWDNISAKAIGREGYANTREIARWAYDNGYSGVIYRHLVDEGPFANIFEEGSADTVYAFFYPDMQVKSADPVVYDDDGEVIPLDKRFDWENDDIRYSREMEGLQAQEEITEELKALMHQLTEQNENLKEENADLNKKLASAKRASTITERKTAQRADVRRVARSILQNESSTLSIDDVEDGFQRIADSIVAGETGPGVFGQLVKEAQKLADMIVDSTEVNVNDYVEDTYRELKRYLRKTPIKITEEMMLDIPDFKDFKSRNRYNFRLKEDGTDIDVLWSEMAGLFGSNFFPEDIQNPVDMLMHLEDVIGKIAPNVQNPYRSVSDAEIHAKQLTNTILMELMSDRIKANHSTKIDRAIESRVKKIQEQLDEMGRAQAQQREQRKQTDVRNKILRINDSLQRMATKGGKAATQHAPESLIKSVREFASVITESLMAAENRKKEGYYERADKLAAEMGKGFKISQVEEYRRIEDQSKRNERAILRLQSVLAEYQAMKSNDEYAITYDATVDEMLQGLMRDLRGTLNQGDLYELNSKQLISVARTLQALMHTVQNANMAFSMGENKRISDMANKWAGEIKQVKWTGPGMKSMAQRFVMWQMSPDVFFNYLSGYAKNNEGQVIQKAFAQGTERMLAVQREFYETFKGFTESSDKAVKKELGQLLNPKGIKGMNANQIIRGEKIGLVDMNGNSVNITRGMAMQLLMLLDQKDSLRSIALGGLSLPNLETYYKGETQAAYGNGDDYALITRNIGESYTELLQQLKELDQQRDNPPEGIDEWTEEAYAKWQQDIDQKKEDVLKEMGDLIKSQEEIALGIRDKLAAEMTDLEKQLIKAAHSWYGRTGEMMADVFVKMYGYRPALVDNYVPIHRDMASLKVDIRDMAGAEKAFNLENSGFTIERVKSISPILLTDFFGELDQQKAKMARYVGFAQIQKDFNKIWKYQVGSNGMTINRLIRNRFGSGDTTFGVSGEDYIEHYVADVAGGHTEGGIFNAFYGSYAAATLRFNPRVAVSQAASIPTAASVVGWKAAAKGFARGLPKAASTDYKNQLAAKNEWFYQRYRGEGGSTELSDIKRKGGIFERVANSDVGKKLFNWCQNFDVLSTGSIMWSMAEEAVQAKGITANMDGYEDAVNQMYTDIIRKSQPNYTTTERADMLRDQRNGMKILTMFKTQSSQNLNLLLDANLEFIKMRQDLKNGANGVTKADLDAAKTKMANAYTGVFLGGTVGFVLIRTLMNFLMAAVNPYRDKETNEVTAAATAAGIGKEMLSSVAGMVALGGPAYDFFSSVISGDKYYGLSDSAISALSGTLENTAKVLQAALDSNKEITGDMLYKLMNSLAQTQGIPVGNAKKLADMMATYIRDIRGGTFGQFTTDKTSLKQYEAQVVKHYIEGDTDKVDNALAMLWAKSTKEGDEAIRKDVIGKIKGYLKGAYTAADITDLDVERILEYIGADDPAGILAKWDFEMEYPDIESPSDSMVAKYNQRGSIPADVFLEAYEYEKTLTADKDKNGKTINGSKKAKLVAYIVSLKLPKAQAKQLFLLLNGGSLQGTPWE